MSEIERVWSDKEAFEEHSSCIAMYGAILFPWSLTPLWFFGENLFNGIWYAVGFLITINFTRYFVQKAIWHIANRVNAAYHKPLTSEPKLWN